MPTWILILIISSDVYSGDQVNMHSVPGFHSQRACVVASEQIAKAINSGDKYTRPNWTRAVCVRTL